MLALAGVPCGPGPFFMSGQLCVALCEAGGEGVAVLADPASDAVVPVAEDVVAADDVVDDAEE